MAGAWLVPTEGELPVYLCHVMEGPGMEEFAPLPAEGSGCGLCHDAALHGALLEACQARVGAISGARDDITRLRYPKSYDRRHLTEWRNGFSAPGSVRFTSWTRGTDPKVRSSGPGDRSSCGGRGRGSDCRSAVSVARSGYPHRQDGRTSAPPWFPHDSIANRIWLFLSGRRSTPLRPARSCRGSTCRLPSKATS